jgi:uncharacterized damage-inducible protein DinB
MPGTVPPVANEREGLLAFLAHQRQALKVTAFGLTEEQLRATPSASPLSVGGLIKHCSSVERGWMDNILERTRQVDTEGYLNDFEMTPDDTLESLIADFDAAARETEEVLAGVADLGQPVKVPDAPWFPKDVEAWSVRWVLLHLIQEIARHAGHADIVRESVDGATGYALQAAAEGWPETPWLKPWHPAEPATA